MKGATHFIEQYMDVRTGKIYQSTYPQPLAELKNNLNTTKVSVTLKTLLVIKIKFKNV